MFDIWHTENKLAEDLYAKNNYIIENQITGYNLCVIYFSSNNIWFPNTEEAFKRSFIQNDFYEWKNFKHKKAQKLIFVRDIYKSWYVNGINKEYNSVDKLFYFLQEETKGMRIITIGSSAGGYAAALFGALLEAEFVICFSAQFDLRLEGCLDRNSFLQRNLHVIEKSKYYNISPLLESSKVSIFYFMPCFVKQDIDQMRTVEHIKNVHIMKMRSNHHGVPVLKNVLNKLINADLNTLLSIFSAYHGKTVSPLVFSVKLVGVLPTFKFILHTLIKQIGKRVFK